MYKNIFPAISSSSWDKYTNVITTIEYQGDYSCTWQAKIDGDYIRYKVRDGSLNGKTLLYGFESLAAGDGKSTLEVRIYEATNTTYENIYLKESAGAKELEVIIPPDAGDLEFRVRHERNSAGFPETTITVVGLYLYDTKIDSTLMLNFHKVLKDNLPASVEKGTEHIYFTTDGTDVGMFISTSEGQLMPVGSVSGNGSGSDSKEYHNAYTQQYIDERINDIKNLTKGDYFSFVVATDIHLRASDGDSGRVEQVRDFMMITKQIPIDYIACCGDLLDESGSFVLREPRFSKVVDILKKCHSPFYASRGNHDYNDRTDENLTVQNKIWHNDITKHMYNTPSQKIVYPKARSNSAYYYVDDEVHKHRLIVLCTFEPNTDTHGNPYKNTDGTSSFTITNITTKQQIDWLVNEAMDMSGKNDWVVSFMSHCVPYVDAEFHNYGYDNAGIRELIKAFQTGVSASNIRFKILDLDSQKWNDNYLVSKDFAQQGAIPVIGFFGGHVHDDCYKKVDGLNLVVSTCTMGNQRKSWTADLTPTRLPPERNYSNNAISMNLFIVHKSTRTVNVIKIGSKRDNAVLTSSDFTFTY